EANPSGPRDVTILGGGVMGLFAAYALSGHRERNPGSIGPISIVAERFEDLTSHNAGGLFEPFSIGGDPDVQLLVDSYSFYHDIALGEPPEPEFETVDIEHLSLFSSERDPMPSLVGLGYVPHGLPGSMRIGGQRHDTFVHRIFFMDVALLMRHLFAVVARRGVRITRGVRIRNMSELTSPVVIECAGLAARELVDDPNLRPMLGHLIRLQNQPRGLLDIEHDLHVMSDQIGESRAAVSDFLSTPVDDILTAFSPDGAAADDPVRIRFPGGFEAPVRARLEEFFDVVEGVRGRLETDTPTPDPDMPNLSRLCVFGSGRDRNRFVDGIALITRVAELRGKKELQDRSNRLFAALIPRYAKRFGFIAELPTGLSYFLPVLREPVVRASDGRFRYVSEHTAAGPVAAGVAGGTTIDREDLPLDEHQREFAELRERFGSLGFS
ncbi:MAG: FAD-dependent oxidoreductase, partial [Pseudomonadota bacterium]